MYNQIISPKYIEQNLVEYLSELENKFEVTLGLLLLTVVVNIIGYIVQYRKTISIAKKIDDYKHNLKKSESKFSLYSEIQIKILSNIYQELTSLIVVDGLVNRKTNSCELSVIYCKEWSNFYSKISKTYRSKKYIIPKEIDETLLHLFEKLTVKQELVDVSSKLNEMFVTLSSDGDVDFVGDDDLRNEYKDRINEISSENIVLNEEVSIRIEQVLDSVDKYFRKLE